MERICPKHNLRCLFCPIILYSNIATYFQKNVQTSSLLVLNRNLILLVASKTTISTDEFLILCIASFTKSKFRSCCIALGNHTVIIYGHITHLIINVFSCLEKIIKYFLHDIYNVYG